MTVIVLHTTEGGWNSALSTFAQKPNTQPHRLYNPVDDQDKFYISYDQPAKALFNESGGVETNRRGGVIQIEIVGFAGNVPTYTDDWYKNLANYLKKVCAATGTPIKFPCKWVPVDHINPLSNAAWLKVEGIIGHQHVPENKNKHSDPGDMNKLERFMLPAPLEEKGTTVPAQNLYALGSCMLTVSELYKNHRGMNPTPDEYTIWSKDIESKLEKGEDIEPTFGFISWALDQQAAEAAKNK